MRGPYSPDLTADYYELATHVSASENYGCFLPKFDTEKFAQIIRGNDIEWLEVATTLLSVYNNNKGKMADDKLIAFALERTKEIKSNYGDDFITQVVTDLFRYDLLS